MSNFKCQISNKFFCHNFSQRGFTFIELILMIALVMILGLGSTIFYARFFTQNAVSNTVDQLIGDFRKAQLYAMMGKQSNNCIGSPCNWGVNYSSNIITLYLGNSYANRTQAFSETFTTPSSVSLSNFDINFARITGLARNNGIPITNASPLSIIILGSNNISQTIIINSQGVVTRQ